MRAVDPLELGRMAYYLERADQIVDEDETDGDDQRLVNVLHRAGLPVSTHAVSSYFTWADRHLYSAELKAWSAEHKRQRAR